jgi:hypothetical protein
MSTTRARGIKKTAGSKQKFASKAEVRRVEAQKRIKEANELLPIVPIESLAPTVAVAVATEVKQLKGKRAKTVTIIASSLEDAERAMAAVWNT